MPHCRSLAVAPLNYLLSSPFFKRSAFQIVCNTASISKAWNCCERRKQ